MGGDGPVREALRAFRADDSAANDAIRAIVAHPTWWVPVAAADQPLLWTLGDVDCVGALLAPELPVTPTEPCPFGEHRALGSAPPSVAP
ncbi:MAG: hypothetical protein ABMB14_30655 [Myxococcota bacterium]